MASQLQTIEIGEIVLYKDCLCRVIGKDLDVLGWNIYTVEELNTNQRHQCNKYSLGKVDLFTPIQDNDELTIPELINETMSDIPICEWDTPMDFDFALTSIVTNDQDTEVKPVLTTSARHETLTDQQLDNMANERLSVATSQQTKWAVNIFRDFLRQNGCATDFENLEEAELAEQLRKLYGGMRQRSKRDGDPGEPYSKTGMINVRYGIQRFLQSPPISRPISLSKDKAFMKANQVFEGRIAQLKKEGKDITQHKTTIENEDMRKLYETKTLNTTDPTGLQDKVFVDIMLHFGRRGREGLANMKKDTFRVTADARGVEYITIIHNEYDKNPKTIEHENKQQCMFAAPYDPLCPVASFKKYVSLLHPKQPAFWQRPKVRFTATDLAWYENAPVGKNKLSNMLKRISHKANLTTIYTNHCLKATGATVLKEAGVNNKDICGVTGHRNPGSLDSYVRAPTMKRRLEMSSILQAHKHKCSTSAATSSDTVALPASVNAAHESSQSDELALLSEVATVDTPEVTQNAEVVRAPLDKVNGKAPSVLSNYNTVNTVNTVSNDFPSMFKDAAFNGPITINIQYASK